MARKSKITDLKRRATPAAQTSAEPSVLIELSKISPDPNQPREDLVPQALKERYFSGDLLPTDLMLAWIGLFVPAEAVSAIGSFDLDSIAGWLKENSMNRNSGTLYKLCVLADQIAAVDQTTAISIRSAKSEGAPFNARYLIITGERRYWAYILLTIFKRQIATGEGGNRAPDRIKALVEADGQPVLIHQIIENISREGFNAVELAQAYEEIRKQLAALQGVETVTWKTVEAFLGIKSRYRVYVSNVMKLDPAVRDLIAAHGLAEFAVRPITSKLKDRPELQLKATKHLVALNQAEDDLRQDMPALGEYIDILLGESKPQTEKAEKKPRKITPFSEWKTRSSATLKSVKSLTKGISGMEENDRAKAKGELEKLQAAIEDAIQNL